jgi:hypothetical protein
MDTLSGIAERIQNGPNLSFKALGSFQDLSPRVQSHVARVYLALSMATMSAAAGVYAQMTTRFAGNHPGLGAIASFGLMIWMAMTRDEKNLPARLGKLAGFGFFQGLFCHFLKIFVFVFMQVSHLRLLSNTLSKSIPAFFIPAVY